MKKICSILIILSLFVAVPTKSAHADFEFVQKALKIVQKIQTKVKNVVDKVMVEYRKFSEMRTGVQGAVKNVKDKVDDVKDVAGEVKDSANSAKAAAGGDLDAAENLAGTNINLKRLKPTNPSFVKDVNDTEQTKKAIEENLVPEYGKGQDVEVAKAQKEINDAGSREIISSLYAIAYVEHYKLKEEQKAEVEAPKFENDRAIAHAIALKSMQTARRFARISYLEAIKYDYNMNQQTTNFKKTAEKKDSGEEQ